MAPYWSLVIVDWLSCSDEKKYEPVIFFFSIPQPPPLLPSLQLKLQQQQKQQQQRTKDRERDRERERERERATYGCKPLGSRTQHLAPASGGSDRSLASLVHTFQLGGSSSLSLCILFFFPSSRTKLLPNTNSSFRKKNNNTHDPVKPGRTRYNPVKVTIKSSQSNQSSIKTDKIDLKPS